MHIFYPLPVPKKLFIVSIYKMRGIDLCDSPPFELEISFKKHFVALVELNWMV